MTDSLINLFHCNADNVGDQMCGPSQYLWPTQFTNKPLNRGLPTNPHTAILGGGQIFEQLRKLTDVNNARPQRTKLVAWGVGLPLRGVRDAEVESVAARCVLFSTRNYDWRDSLTFVPCASCLSPLFRLDLEPKHDVVVYRHKRKIGPLDIPASFPTLSNALTDFRAVIEFISSGDTVVTSSYHGVYWAQLLGRRVICIPYNHKFLSFENPPTIAEAHTWAGSLRTARRTRALLEEYRHLNRNFALKAEKIWND